MDDDELKDAMDANVLKDALYGAGIKVPAMDNDELKDAVDGDELKDALDGAVIKVPAVDVDELKDALDAPGRLGRPRDQTTTTASTEVSLYSDHLVCNL